MRKFHCVNILILFWIIPFQLKSQETQIVGKALDYSGKEITFYTIPDPILSQKVILGTAKVAKDGSFFFKFSVSGTIEIYSELEKYCGTMVVEPGKKYSVVLPPFSLRNGVEAHSAYFKPAPYWLGLPETENNDINFKVRSFTTEFNQETVKNTSAIYQKESKEIVNQIIQKLEQKYANVQDQYFKTLMQYSFAELEFSVNQTNPELVIQKYFAKKPLQLQHPAYQKVFKAIFTDYLRKLAQDSRYQKLGNIINTGDYNSLVLFFENRGYQKEFAEIVVLKGLNDGYYSGRFQKEGIIKAFETAKNSNSSPLLLTVADQIKTRLTLLSVGSPAPPVKLMNINREQVTLDKFKGKFIYLSFFNSKSPDCRTELDSLASIEKHLRQVVSVVSISLDDDFVRAGQLWRSKGFTWELLDGSRQKQLVMDYNASITPVFYLIAPDRKLILSPALAPTHDFESIFLRLFRDYSFKQKRKAPLEPVKF